MGVKVNRIEKEYVLNIVQEKKIGVLIHGHKKEYHAKIANIEDEYLELVSAQDDWKGFAELEEIRVFFTYFGHVMTFNSCVLAIGDYLRIKMPIVMYRNLQRKYERVPALDDMSVSFVINEQRIELDFPKSEEFEAIENLEYSDEWDTSSINKLVADFRERIEDDDISDTIKMFRENRPVEAWELLVSSTGKILYIPTFDTGIPGDGANIHPRILTHPYFQLIIDGHHFEKIDKDEFLQFLDEKKQEGVFSLLVCPILYYEYVIGYIYLESQRKISKDILEYVYEFSRVLSYLLLHNGYFKDKKYRPSQYDANIVDISASGIMFSHSSPDLKSNLMLYADLDLQLVIGDRRLSINSRVMRKFPQDNLTFYGLQFMDIKPEDFRFLFEYVYGRDFTSHDDSKWEGGADAPVITFDQDEAGQDKPAK